MKKINLNIIIFIFLAIFSKVHCGTAPDSDATTESTAAKVSTLELVKQKGFVQCGVSQGVPGFSNPDDKGNWSGLDVDFCHALAAAVLGDATKVKFTPLSAKERFTALQSGEIDVLSRNTTWTFTRDSALGLDFAGVIYYDGQGFMVRKSLDISKATELDGASVCTNTGTTTELNASDFFRKNNMTMKLVAFEKTDEVVAAYDAGRCDVYTTDTSGLYAQRVKLKNPDEHVILEEVISKEPLGPVVRHGDNQWSDIARWTLNALISAEELGVSSKNIDEMLQSKNPSIRRLLGLEGNMGEKMGLNKDWVVQIVKGVGNYGESFERNLGETTPLKIQRGLNQIWSEGGILYSPPLR